MGIGTHHSPAPSKGVRRSAPQDPESIEISQAATGSHRDAHQHRHWLVLTCEDAARSPGAPWAGLTAHTVLAPRQRPFEVPR